MCVRAYVRACVVIVMISRDYICTATEEEEEEEEECSLVNMRKEGRAGTSLGM